MRHSLPISLLSITTGLLHQGDQRHADGDKQTLLPKVVLALLLLSPSACANNEEPPPSASGAKPSSTIYSNDFSVPGGPINRLPGNRLDGDDDESTPTSRTTPPPCEYIRTSEGTAQITAREQYGFCATDLSKVKPELSSLVDTHVEVEARWVTIPSDHSTSHGPGALGLRCRTQGDLRTGDGYDMAISPVGYFELDKYVGGQQSSLKDGRSPVATSRDWISLRFECLGKAEGPVTLKGYVEDRLIFTAVDAKGLGSGSPEMAVVNWGQGEAVGEFDDFAVHVP
jgi:hypothetical protein